MNGVSALVMGLRTWTTWSNVRISGSGIDFRPPDADRRPPFREHSAEPPPAVATNTLLESAYRYIEPETGAVAIRSSNCVAVARIVASLSYSAEMCKASSTAELFVSTDPSIWTAVSRMYVL